MNGPPVEVGHTDSNTWEPNLSWDELDVLEETHWWLVIRRKVFLDFLKRACARMDRASLVLDCGFGTGILMSELREFASPVGLDEQFDVVERCRAKGLERLVVGRLQDLPFRRGSFDVVCAFDVLEHLDDDLGALRQMRDLVRPGGYLVVSVPAYRWLWGVQDDIAEHKRRYRVRDLGEKVAAARCTVERLTYFNFVLLPAIAAARLFRRGARWWGREVRETDFAWSPSTGVANDVLTRLFGLELNWLRTRSLPFGGSILCVARRGAAS